MICNHSEEIENINYHLQHNLKPFRRISERRYIRIQINQQFFEYLKNTFSVSGRFKPVPVIMVEQLQMPVEKTLAHGKISFANRLEARVSNSKQNGFRSKPYITIRFIRTDRICYF